jgi:hypothetical protein
MIAICVHKINHICHHTERNAASQQNITIKLATEMAIPLAIISPRGHEVTALAKATFSGEKPT